MSDKRQQVIDALSDGEQLARLGGIVAEQMMTTEPTCIRPETPASEIVRLIYSSSFHHLPVTDDNGVLVGVVPWFS